MTCFPVHTVGFWRNSSRSSMKRLFSAFICISRGISVAVDSSLAVILNSNSIHRQVSTLIQTCSCQQQRHTGAISIAIFKVVEIYQWHFCVNFWIDRWAVSKKDIQNCIDKFTLLDNIDVTSPLEIPIWGVQCNTGGASNSPAKFLHNLIPMCDRAYHDVIKFVLHEQQHLSCQDFATSASSWLASYSSLIASLHVMRWSMVLCLLIWWRITTRGHAIIFVSWRITLVSASWCLTFIWNISCYFFELVVSNSLKSSTEVNISNAKPKTPCNTFWFALHYRSRDLNVCSSNV